MKKFIKINTKINFYLIIDKININYIILNKKIYQNQYQNKFFFNY